MMILLSVLAALLVTGETLASHKKNGRIMGGSDATEGLIPYQISIQDAGVDPPVHICGGSILDETTIITAADCVATLNPGSGHLQMVAGEFQLSVNSGNEQRRTIISITPHGFFNEISHVNDVAIVKIGEALTFNEFVQPVVLPEPFYNSTGVCRVAGFGSNNFGGQPQDILQYIDVAIVYDDRCSQAYPVIDIEESMICAGGELGIDACTSDGGAPMYCGDYENGGGYLAGIVSFGHFCGEEGTPGVYTEVSYFLDWIAENR